MEDEKDKYLLRLEDQIHRAYSRITGPDMEKLRATELQIQLEAVKQLKRIADCLADKISGEKNDGK